MGIELVMLCIECAGHFLWLCVIVFLIYLWRTAKSHTAE